MPINNLPKIFLPHKFHKKTVGKRLQQYSSAAEQQIPSRDGLTQGSACFS